MSDLYEWVREKKFASGNTARPHIRWSGRPPGTARGLWQLTRVEPPAGTDAWEQPEGLVLQGPLDIDPGADADEYDVDLTAADPSRAARVVRGARSAEGGATRYWLRVVGLDEDGRPVSNPSNAVAIDFVPNETVEIVPPPVPTQSVACELTLVSYEPKRLGSPDRHRRVIANADALGFEKGKRYYLAPDDDDDLLEEIGDAVESVADAIGDAAAWVAAAYDDIKKAAIDVAAEAIPGCASSPKCRGVLSTALDAGLAAMGLPPELPTFEEFTEMARGYLAAQLVTAAGLQNVPLAQDAADRAAREFVAAARSAASSGGGGAALFRPDPAYQDRPAFVLVRARNPHREPAVSSFSLGWGPEEIYERQSVPGVLVPPGAHVDIPVTLVEYHDWKFQSDRTREAFRNVWEKGAEAWLTAAGNTSRTRIRPFRSWSWTSDLE